MAWRCFDSTCQAVLDDGPAVLEHHQTTGHLGAHPYFPSAGASVPPPRGPSLVAGAIDRSLDEARQRYRAELVAMWHEVVEALPDD